MRIADSRGLGPAFGTKFLYFCQSGEEAPRALILDALVAAWMNDKVGARVNPVPWSAPTYRRYLDMMHGWSTALGCLPESLEMAIFQDMAATRNSPWSPTRLLGSK